LGNLLWFKAGWILSAKVLLEQHPWSRFRVIALSWFFAKDQFKPVIIVDRSAHFAKAQAMLWWSIVSNDIKCHAPDQSQIGRRMIFTGSSPNCTSSTQCWLFSMAQWPRTVSANETNRLVKSGSSGARWWFCRRWIGLTRLVPPPATPAIRVFVTTRQYLDSSGSGESQGGHDLCRRFHEPPGSLYQLRCSATDWHRHRNERC